MAGVVVSYEHVHSIESFEEFSARVNALFAQTSQEDFGAHQWLDAFRQTEHVWAVCSRALHDSCNEAQDSAVALLAAQLLHAKVISAWFELSDDNQTAVVNVRSAVNVCFVVDDSTFVWFAWQHVLNALAHTPDSRANKAVHKATARL